MCGGASFVYLPILSMPSALRAGLANPVAGSAEANIVQPTNQWLLCLDFYFLEISKGWVYERQRCIKDKEQDYNQTIVK